MRVVANSLRFSQVIWNSVPRGRENGLELAVCSVWGDVSGGVAEPASPPFSGPQGVPQLGRGWGGDQEAEAGLSRPQALEQTQNEIFFWSGKISPATKVLWTLTPDPPHILSPEPGHRWNLDISFPNSAKR